MTISPLHICPCVRQARAGKAGTRPAKNLKSEPLSEPVCVSFKSLVSSHVLLENEAE